MLKLPLGAVAPTEMLLSSLHSIPIQCQVGHQWQAASGSDTECSAVRFHFLRAQPV